MCAGCEPPPEPAAPVYGELLASAGAAGTSVIDANTDIKSQLLHCIPTYIEFRRANPKDYPRLDLAGVERYTRDIEALGFKGVAAYTVKSNAKESSTGYARLLVGEELRCLAELNQAFPEEGEPSPVRAVFMSALGDGWGLSTTDRKMEWANWLLRRPRSMWVSLPDAPMTALLDRHLSDRRRVSEWLGVRVLEDLSMEAHCRRELGDSLARREVIAAKSVFGGMMDALLFKWFPKTEWWGDLKKARRR